MALKFIGERTVGTLNGMKSGFVKDDLYRVYDAGILVPGGVSVDHGDFVSWDGTKWVRESDIKIARSDEITNTNSSIAPEYTKKTYEANSYVMQDGVLYTNPNAIGTAEDWNPAHWTQTTVAEMMTNSAPTWKQRTVSKSIAGGRSETISVQDHEIVDLTVMRRNPSSGSATLMLNLYGECYVFLDKGPNTVVRTYDGGIGVSTTDSVFGTPELTKDLQKAVSTLGSSIPDEWNPEDFGQLNVCGEDTRLTISDPSLTSTTQNYAILHYLGGGKLIITPKP